MRLHRGEDRILNQIALYVVGRAAILVTLVTGADIILIFLAADGRSAMYHGISAVGTVNQTGKRIDFLVVFCSAGIHTENGLHKLKLSRGNDCFVSVLNSCPLGLVLYNPCLDLVVRGRGFALLQNARVNGIL